MNTNRNTIKYIDVYFKVTNDVGDLRKTGHFRAQDHFESLNLQVGNGTLPIIMCLETLQI